MKTFMKKQLFGLSLFAYRENFKYYLFQYRVDTYQERKRIRIDGKKPFFGFDAEGCKRRYCIDCGGKRWREKNKHLDINKD